MHKYILSDFNFFMITNFILRLYNHLHQQLACFLKKSGVSDSFNNKQVFECKITYNQLIILFITGLLSACNSTEEINYKQAKADSIQVIELPAPLAISPAESQRLNYISKNWYDTVLKASGFNGGMIVAKNGNIVFEAYNGSAHFGGTDLITGSTPLHIASVSKTFTAMAVLKLWQDGKLNIDEELSKYLIGFNYPGVTIRTLLNHRSGLPNYVYFMELQAWDISKYVRNEDVLKYLIERKPLLENIAPPNTHFSYCNTNYALLSLLIEKVSGKKYADYLQHTFFGPLQMKNTFVFNISDSAKAAPSYDWRGTPIAYTFLDNVYGDKNIYTTPKDLLQWDKALNSGKIFTPATLQQAYQPYSNEKPGIKNYGLGWRMNIYGPDKKIIFHNGWWHGSNAAFIRLIQDSATIIVIGNKFNRSIYHAKEIANAFGNYYTPEEEEEGDNIKTSENILQAADSLIFRKKMLTKQDSLLQEKFKDLGTEKKIKLGR